MKVGYLTKEKYMQSVAYTYLRQGLSGLDDSSVGPVKDAFLLLLDDFFQKKLSLEEFDFVSTQLSTMPLFSNNTYTEDPEFAFVLDSALVLSHPEIQRTPQSKKVKTGNALKVLQDYWEEHRAYVDRLKSLVNSLAS